jgi:hypothetical protein
MTDPDPFEYPPLSDRTHWEVLGREDGRRAVPTDAGGPYPVHAELQHALDQEAAEAREDAAEKVRPIDETRLVLHSQRRNLVAPGPNAIPPVRDKADQERKRLDQQIAVEDAARARCNQELDTALQRLTGEAGRAAGAYRAAFHSSCRLKIELTPLEPRLPPGLGGPLVDPVERDDL